MGRSVATRVMLSRYLRALCATLIGALVLSACAANPITVDSTPRPLTLFVVSHGWHTGLVLRNADIAPDSWPEIAPFSAYEYVEIGWGDRAFYQARETDVGDVLGAALVPGPSALQVVGFNGAVAANFPMSEVVALPVAADGLTKLVATIRASYERDAEGKAITLGPSLYGDGFFYASLERFHLFNTCNSWTSRALRAAGFDVSSTLSASDLMRQVRGYAQAARSANIER